ncbi:MAG: hypothetical protein LBC27_07290, partial [Spirochaetaceae bacterium]|nr:hypothetical protein [Spirochaetaceae bacterium]
EYLDTAGNLVVFGNAPEWDMHMLTGWKIEGEEGEELTLNTPVTKNITVTAQWADAPRKPYYTITFSRNAGNGTFEKRFAIPQKRYWKAKADAENTITIAGITEEVDGEQVSVKLTDNEEYKAENAAPVYAEFKITDKYPEFMLGSNEENDTVTQNAGKRIPKFTREHYDIDTPAWKDLKGNAISNPDDEVFTEDTTLYQQWKEKTYTLKFDANGHGAAPMPDVIANVSEPKSAAGGLAAAKNYTVMPSITGVNTDGKISEGDGDDAVEYTFAGWADAKQGGNLIGVSTPLYPKDSSEALDSNDSSREITLYAQWTSGLPPRTFTYKGYVQEWTVPETGIYQIEAYGAGREESSSGKGGYISGEIKLTAGKPLYIYCGGLGEVYVSPGRGQRPGGWNGGGQSGGTSGSGVNNGGGGHGATDVRTVKALNDKTGTKWDDATSLASRIIVAGGGGGHGSNSSTPGNGGLGIAAGGDVYYFGTDAQESGTYVEGGGLTSPGTANPSTLSRWKAAGFGYGGDGGVATRGGGGGGGGYYGGAGGTTGYPDAPEKFRGVFAGGGGSSWAKTTAEDDDLKFTNVFPQEDGDGGGTYVGTGKVIITLLEKTSE